MSRRSRRRLRRLWWWAIGSAALAFGASVSAVLLFRFVAPPLSAVMLQDRVANLVRGDTEHRFDYRWVPWEEISPQVALAVVAAEDQRFPVHRGFDFHAIDQALADRRRGGRLRGASTISQQVAKNLFLWPGRSWLRKGLEAYFTVLIEALWPKRRILETYLNIAQLAPGVFGVEAASQRFFGKPASQLSTAEAARLAAVLPRPSDWSVDRPSPGVSRRATRIQREMGRLGGPSYVRDL